MTDVLKGQEVPQHLATIRERAAAYRRPANVESTVETRVIKENDLFMLTEVDGTIPAGNQRGLGLYRGDTRFLSTYELRLAGNRAVVLGSSGEKNCLLSVDLTNGEIEGEGSAIRSDSISINSSSLIHDAVYQRLTFTNYGLAPVDLPISLSVDADFRDIFEVRGYKSRPARGELLPPRYGDRSITLAYRGLDGILRQTELHFAEPPERIAGGTAHFTLHLTPREPVTLHLTIVTSEGEDRPKPLTYDRAHHALELSYSRWLQRNTYVESSSDLFDAMFLRSVLDLRLLATETEWGPVVTAGTPWYACVFGRDSLISALQSLMFCPDLARATLRCLAHYQGRAIDPWREEEPGKIFHELRRGEMARCHEIPHTPYYGTADATPLWLILLAETFRWTGDRALVDELWEPSMRALEWIDRFGDPDGDGYVEYWCHDPVGGLVNHGWKDSAIAVFDSDGTITEQPTALVEVQAYVWAAKRGLADLAELRGDSVLAHRLRADADRLRTRFNRDFWMEDRDFMAFALDGQKRPVRTVTSNPGHALWTGIVDPEHAARMVARFKRSDLLSGWGVRCVSEEEPLYNPMGYQIGPVWPHDVSLLVAGLRRYGFNRDALIIATQLYHAGLEFLYFRLPELFTGIARSHNPFPVPWPVACSPQAWAAGTTPLLLQTFLGIEPDAGHRRVVLRPALPDWLHEVRVSQLAIGDATLDLRFIRHGEQSTVQVLSKTGSLEVMI